MKSRQPAFCKVLIPAACPGDEAANKISLLGLVKVGFFVFYLHF